MGVSGRVWACLGVSGSVWECLAVSILKSKEMHNSAAFLGGVGVGRDLSVSGRVWACLGMSGSVWECLAVSIWKSKEMHYSNAFSAAWRRRGTARGSGGGIHRTVDKNELMSGNPSCRAIEMLITP